MSDTLFIILIMGMYPAFIFLIVKADRMVSKHDKWLNPLVLLILTITWPIGIPKLFLYERELTKALIPKIPTARIHKHV